MNMLNCLGDWNPQLLREIKGKLEVRPIALSLASSLSVQLILLLIVLLGFETPPNFLDSSKLWWTSLFVGSSIIGPLALIAIGTYWLIYDLVKEGRRGTLSFIRLSPQSAQSIFLGKLLGVPILLYLSILFALPLHLASGILAGNSFWKVLAYDAACLASVFFFYSWALLYGLLTSRQPKSLFLYPDGFNALFGTILGFSILCLPAFKIGNFYKDVLKSFSPLTLLPHLSGFHADSLELTFFGTLSLIVGTCLTISWWIWKLLERSFPYFNVPLVPKKQGYGMSACVALLLLGHLLQGQAHIPWLHEQLVEVLDLYFIYCLWLNLFSVPTDQSCIDWVRSRHTFPQCKQNLWVNLIVNEKSPVTLAIALNSCILLTPIVGWVMFWPTQAARGSAILAIVLNVSLISLYTGILQVWGMMQIPATQNLRGVLLRLLGMTIILFSGPLFIGYRSLFQESIASRPVLWLFTPNAWIAAKYASPVVILAIAIAQGGLIGLLNLKLTRQLHQAGESASKALLAPSR